MVYNHKPHYTICLIQTANQIRTKYFRLDNCIFLRAGVANVAQRIANRTECFKVRLPSIIKLLILINVIAVVFPPKLYHFLKDDFIKDLFFFLFFLQGYYQGMPDLSVPYQLTTGIRNVFNRLVFVNSGQISSSIGYLTVHTHFLYFYIFILDDLCCHVILNKSAFEVQ